MNSEIIAEQIIRNIKLHILGDIELDNKEHLIFACLEEQLSDLDKYISDTKSVTFYSKLNGGHHLMYQNNLGNIYIDKTIYNYIKDSFDLNDSIMKYILQWYFKYKFDLNISNHNIFKDKYLNDVSERRWFKAFGCEKVK